MRRGFPSWQEAKWWVYGGIIYAWATFFFIAVFEPTREWLAHDGPFRHYDFNDILLISPIGWGFKLAYWIFPDAWPGIIGLVTLFSGTLFGAALGYVVRTAVRIISRW